MSRSSSPGKPVAILRGGRCTEILPMDNVWTQFSPTKLTYVQSVFSHPFVIHVHMSYENKMLGRDLWRMGQGRCYVLVLTLLCFVFSQLCLQIWGDQQVLQVITSAPHASLQIPGDKQAQQKQYVYLFWKRTIPKENGHTFEK